VDHGFAMVTTKIDRISRQLSNLKTKRFEAVHKSPHQVSIRLLRGFNFEEGAINLLETATNNEVKSTLTQRLF
jgi:hypothetical protein